MEVVNNNADKVVGNTYIWNIDSDNYNNKSMNSKEACMRTVRKGVFGTTSDINTYTNVDIGIRLRDIRKKNRYTIEQLAKELEVKEETIQAWEDSLALPADKYVKKLSELYNVTENYLLGLDK